ncbi:ATP-binding protein [Microbacterium sp. SA39]|uniref:ATP-binding protein n=1 Tax=Microbacterium sp. SA39 TaxID=1263625 RepID=UPI0005FA20A6|nr:ATP-binding protein [Microbacterium sp. SA39]KJQ55468.1 Archaeal ATPase [Microbacterium sp. SA39]
MDPVRNPYSPGAGRKPAALVGRDKALKAWATSIERTRIGRTDQPVILYGLRGVGKTVLLSEFRRNAAKRDWIVAQIEAGAGKTLRELVGEALYAPLADIARASAGKRLLKAIKTALSFKASYDTNGIWSFGLDLDGTPGGGADTGILDTDLKKLIHDLAEAAEEEGVGLAILIDEAQDLDPAELITLCTVAHAAAQDNWAVLFGFAGLPSLPRILAEAKSYAERFEYFKIEQIEEDVVSEALSIPAAQEDATWDDEAIELVVAASGRYPYFLQQFGQETWNVASGPNIRAAEAQLGILQGYNQLDNGFFRARWDRATPAEQAYLRAMAPDGDAGSSSGEVAGRMNKKPKSLGPTRANLISKGLVYAPEHGVVAFTVPGMADFIGRQIDP